MEEEEEEGKRDNNGVVRSVSLFIYIYIFVVCRIRIIFQYCVFQFFIHFVRVALENGVVRISGERRRHNAEYTTTN